ncbi:MAG: YncE family protein [Myxococcales bacterium]|nr:YncE family protein [Myxococcales bacterium]
MLLRRHVFSALGAAMLLSAPGVATPPRFEVTHGAETGAMPKGVTVSHDGRTLYVANYGQLDRRNVTLHDALTLREIGHIDLPGIAVETALSRDGRTLFVSNFRRNSVQFVDLARRVVTREVAAGRHPKIVVTSPDGARLFAANWADQSVTEIDVAEARSVRQYAVGANPRGMAVSRQGTLFVANFGGASIDVFEGPGRRSHRRWEHVCAVPRHLALSPDERRLYVTCLTASELLTLDARTGAVLGRDAVGRSPKAVAVLPGGRYVVTADYGGSSVSVVDTAMHRVQRLDVPGMDHASGIAAAPHGLRFYATGWYDDHVYAVGLEGLGPRFRVSPRVEARTREARRFHDAHPAE